MGEPHDAKAKTGLEDCPPDGHPPSGWLILSKRTPTMGLDDACAQCERSQPLTGRYGAWLRIQETVWCSMRCFRAWKAERVGRPE